MTILSDALHPVVELVTFQSEVLRQSSGTTTGSTGTPTSSTSDDDEHSGFQFKFFIWILIFIFAVALTKILQTRSRRMIAARARRRLAENVDREGQSSTHRRRSGLSTQPPPAAKSIKLESVVAPKEVEDDVCAVCLSPLGELAVSRASCSHWLHSNCYHTWLVKDTKHACPVCRTPYDQDVATEN